MYKEYMFLKRISAVLSIVIFICCDSVFCQASEQGDSSIRSPNQFAFVVSDVGMVSRDINDIPASFPQFIVPGFEKQMNSLRQLFNLHYPGTSAPQATIWDGWLPLASLWPSVQTASGVDNMRGLWRQTLLNRYMDAEGYVSSHQHDGLAHGYGWPFPLWTQAKGIGWQFSLAGIPYGKDLGVVKTADISDWVLSGISSLGFDENKGWQLELTQSNSSLTTPVFDVDTYVAPFIRIQWQTDGLGESANPYMEWTTADEPQFDVQRRVHFSPTSKSYSMVYTHIAAYKLPLWKGRVTRLRFNFDNKPGARIAIKSIITAVDSRHNNNNFAYLQGCDTYISWTGDLSFLRENINRMRLALRYAMDEFDRYKNKCVSNPWAGHDGRRGFDVDPNGRKTFYYGRGIGNNYWDLLPFGGKDCLVTIYYYDVLNRFAALERKIVEHPEWNIPAGPLRFDSAALERYAGEVKDYAGRLFWNSDTGRFVSAVDIDGNSYDYGFTFVNCEAIYYGFASDSQAKSILDWLSGRRIVAGDTSQDADIYHWRFAPRATTKRNLDYYCWTWEKPEVIPWGGQVQDGGTVLGFSYFDIMARLKTNGPVDAWQRLSDIISWFEDIKQAGGYRKYYKDSNRGTLQGGGAAGGLGLDAEFFESSLVPQVMLYGFMGFDPRPDGFVINPKLPEDWPQLTINRIQLHNLTLDVTVSGDSVRIIIDGNQSEPLFIYAPKGIWLVNYLDADGRATGAAENVTIESNKDRIPLHRNKSRIVQLKHM